MFLIFIRVLKQHENVANIKPVIRRSLEPEPLALFIQFNQPVMLPL
jgi:hypothetical protein